MLNNRLAAMALMALLLAFAPGGVLAQPGPGEAPTENLTVTAPRAAEAKPTPFLSGGSRWLFPLCPVTVGLVPQDNKRVTERVRQVAALVGAPVWTRGKCNTNAEIVFTAAPQRFLDAAAEKQYRLLGSDPSKAREAAKIRYPIQSWYSTAMMDEHGGLLLMPPDDDICDPYCFFYRGTSPSRIVIGTVVIVVDVAKAQGRKLDALSDYVALMALTQARAFAKCQAAPSIANLMAPDCPDVMRADGLTPGDIAWMRGLYHMSLERARQADEKDLAAVAQAGRGN